MCAVDFNEKIYISICADLQNACGTDLCERFVYIFILVFSLKCLFFFRFNHYSTTISIKNQKFAKPFQLTKLSSKTLDLPVFQKFITFKYSSLENVFFFFSISPSLVVRVFFFYLKLSVLHCNIICRLILLLKRLSLFHPNYDPN